VDFMDLHPMTFHEFLMAIGEDKLTNALQEKTWDILSFFKDKLTDYLRLYMYTGGMPEAVLTYVETHDLEKVRHVQVNILHAYEADFSKHAPHELVPRIRLVWQQIVAQLAKENKKFIYGMLRDGARAKDFEMAIQWLVDAGLLIKCHRVSKPEMPLIAYQDGTAFKLYLHDVGLLLAMTHMGSRILVEGDALFIQFNGALAEQFVIQQFKTKFANSIFYWTNDRSTSEVDFILQSPTEIIPIEVKSGINLKAKSFKLFCEKYKPTIAVRTSLADYKHEEWIQNIPLWAIESIG
jgi:predicted AAA+ superfamily ATPase